MTDEHKNLQAFGVIFANWAVVFFGIWVLPLTDLTKIVLDVISTAAFSMFGVSYFTYKGVIPAPKEESVQKFVFWGNLVVVSLQVVAAFYTIITTWEVFTISGVPVVTYANVVSFLYGTAAVVMMVLLVLYIKRRFPYKKAASRKTKKSTAT